jgi:hypothetical protein
MNKDAEVHAQITRKSGVFHCDAEILPDETALHEQKLSTPLASGPRQQTAIPTKGYVNEVRKVPQSGDLDTGQRVLERPIKQVSLEFPIPSTGPNSVTLWRSEEEGLRLCTEMHDVAERMEVGVLNFEQVSSHRPDERIVDVASAFQDEIAVSKLIVHESDTSAESGLILKASNGDEIVIVAGAYPYSLAVLGVPPMPHIFEPEYEIGHYMRVPIS